MPAPDKFSWVEKPHLAAMARPSDRDELAWLRAQGIQLIISLTESPLRRDWVNDAGLMAVHVPVPDLTAPTSDQIKHVLSVIQRAREQKFGVAVHCAAGLGRTGTLLAVWYVSEGLDAATAIAKVRELRPGSIETPEQERAVFEFAKKDLQNVIELDGNESGASIVSVPSESAKRVSRTIDDAFERASSLADSSQNPRVYFHDVLQIVVKGIDAVAGALWIRNKLGFLHLESQENIEAVFLDQHKNGRQSHNELLRQAFQLSKPMLIEPYGTSGILEEQSAGNPTNFFCMLAPIQPKSSVGGCLELWVDPKHDLQVQRTYLNYLVQMAGQIGWFMRRTKYNDE